MMRGRPVGIKERKMGGAVARSGYGEGSATLSWFSIWFEHRDGLHLWKMRGNAPDRKRFDEGRGSLEDRAETFKLSVLVPSDDVVLRKRLGEVWIKSPRRRLCRLTLVEGSVRQRVVQAHLPFGDIWQDREVLERVPSHLDPGRADEVLGREEWRRAEEVCDLVVAAPVELTHDRVEAVDLPCIVKCEKDYSVGRMEMEDGPKLTVSALEVHGED